MFNRKGQSTLEYALIIAVVIAGLLLMQHYIRRGYAGKLKSSADDMGQQYDPVAYTGNLTFNEFSSVQKNVRNRASTSRHLQNEIKSKTGTENVTGWAQNQNLYSQ